MLYRIRRCAFAFESPIMSRLTTQSWHVYLAIRDYRWCLIAIRLVRSTIISYYSSSLHFVASCPSTGYVRAWFDVSKVTILLFDMMRTARIDGEAPIYTQHGWNIIVVVITGTFNMYMVMSAMCIIHGYQSGIHVCVPTPVPGMSYDILVHKCYQIYWCTFSLSFEYHKDKQENCIFIP